MRPLRPILLSIAAFTLGCSPSSDSGGSGGQGGGSYTPPTPVLAVLYTTPFAGQFAVGRDENIVVTFDRVIVSSSVAASTITVSTVFGPIAGKYQVQGAAVTFNPDQPLPASTPILCTVKTTVQGSGGANLPQEFQWSFRSDDGAQEIATGPGLQQGRIAASAGGLVLAMWVQGDNGTNRVKSRAWQEQNGWGATAELAATPSTISHLKVLCTGDNQAVALWTEGGAAPYSFRTARYSSGAGWGSVQTLASAGATSNLYFAMHRDGWGGAGWRTSDTTYGFRYLNAGGTWGAEADTGEGVLNYTLCPGANGELFTSHATYNLSVNYGVYYASRYIPGSGWSTLDVFNGSLGTSYGTGQYPGGVLSYYARDGDFLIYAFDGTDWSTFEAITSDPGTMTASHFSTAPDGRSCMAWTFDTGGTTDIIGAYLDVQGNQVECQPLESLDTTPGAPIVTFKDDGECWVFFSQADAAAESIWRTRFVAGSGWIDAEEIDDADFACSEPRTSVQGSGGAALWFRSNGSTELVVRILR